MASNRRMRYRLALPLLWLGICVGAIGGLGYPVVAVWLDQNTILVHVVDSDGYQVANAEVLKVEVSKVLVATLAT